MIIEPEILLIGNEDDENIQKICYWLDFQEASFFRINIETDVLEIEDYSLDQEHLIISIQSNREKITLSLNNLKTTFARECYLQYKTPSFPSIFHNQDEMSVYFQVYQRTIDLFFENYIKSNSLFIGIWGYGIIDKIDVLRRARDIGLTIPDTYLKTSLKNTSKNESYISKTLGVSASFRFQNQFFMNYTGRIPKLPEDHRFCSTLVQKEVKKIFEVRVFVFLDTVYSMAIFSQQNQESEVDYRHYSEETPYFEEPFVLPSQLEEQIKLLLSEMNLKTGSIDLIFAEDEQFYFLEINPAGQYDHLGIVNGINPHKIIATKLSEI